MEDHNDDLIEQLRTTLGKMEMTLGAISEAIVRMDETGCIAWCNRTFDRLIHRKHIEVLGAPIAGILPLAIDGKIVSNGNHPWKHALDSLRPRIKIYEYVRSSDGKTLTLEVYATKVHLGEKETNVVFVIRDISMRRKGEAELQQALEEIHESHNELKRTQSQLIQTDRLATIGQLAAGIAHEINNPVGYVNSNLSTLGKYVSSLLEFLKSAQALLGPEAVQSLKQLREDLKIDSIANDIGSLIEESKSGVEKVKKIVLDLRTFARSDSKTGMVLEDLNKILDSVISIVWNEIKYKAELKKNYGNIPLIYCNAQQIGQVFINILVNAAQAIPEKGTITVRTYARDPGVVVQISDTGTGISGDIIDRIFDPFFTTKEVGKGTGLGLSISYDIVRRHGGKIEVESQVGKGTKFTISLPLDFKQ